MAWGVAEAPQVFVDEQKDQPQASKLLPYSAALCHPASAEVQFDVGRVVWPLRRRRYSQVTAGDWRAHLLGLVRPCVPAPHLSPSPPV